MLKNKLFVYLCSVLFLVGCGDSSNNKVSGQSKMKPLICHVGGTMRPIMENLAKVYEKETGQKIEINSAGSGELLAHIELQKEGDLYVCHSPFMDILMHKKLGSDGWAIGELYPVIIVQKGNPKKIKSLQDLTRKDIDLFLTDYKLSTLGRMMPTIFAKAGINFEELNKNKRIETNKSGGYVANIIKTKNADAGIVWNVVAKLRRDGLDTIKINKYLPIPGIDMVTSATNKMYPLTPVRVSISTLKCSTQPIEAEKFAKFLTSPRFIKVFEDAGYGVDSKLIGQKYKDGKSIDVVK
jgi:ABC-type molybdate transport system substrate-binding protein